jgi:predicted phosphodiesterase
MTRIMLLGDTHGNTEFIINHVIPAAKSEGVEWIYQVGDFGYWEHTSWGVKYLDDVQDALVKAGLNLLFIMGNHDKSSMIAKRYAKVSEFYIVRPSIWYAPNGTTWEVAGNTFIALGGAYSIDKFDRLDNERAKADLKMQQMSNLDYSTAYRLEKARSETAETLWFPEEEITDEELDDILTKVEGNIDVILAHDKPLSSNPMIRLMPIAECIPNQRRLQKAVNVLQPKLFVHGHLHVRYTDTIRCGDNNMFTRVEGLGADVPNFNQLVADWQPSDAWEILNL